MGSKLGGAVRGRTGLRWIGHENYGWSIVTRAAFHTMREKKNREHSEIFQNLATLMS